MACEIHSANELVITELILDNVLAEYEPAEIAALLSAFVFQERSRSKHNFTSRLQRGIDAITEIVKHVNRLQERYQVIAAVDPNDPGDGASIGTATANFGLVEVVYEWALGMSFKDITLRTDVLEGTIVRTMTRLDETCREVKNAARLIGDPGLYQKMEAAQELIKRDIMSVGSLYV